METGRADLRDPDLKALSGFAGRVLNLIGPPGSRAERNPHLIGTLDDLLGAIYALIFARQAGFKDRTTGSIEVDSVRRRARALTRGDVRTTGPWMAGFHFNSALFRVAAVYHRSPKVALGVPSGRGVVDVVRTQASARYPQLSRQNLDKIHDQVNTIKHSSKGQFYGRKVKYAYAIAATGELLHLIELWAAPDGEESAAGVAGRPPSPVQD